MTTQMYCQRCQKVTFHNQQGVIPEMLDPGDTGFDLLFRAHKRYSCTECGNPRTVPTKESSIPDVKLPL